MTYVISDIHGCYDEFMELLKVIDFKDEDTLYILGDMTDRGYRNIDVIKYVMQHDNIIPILGNHELMAKMVLPSIAGKSRWAIDKMFLNRIFRNDINLWAYNGGDKTCTEFMQLPKNEQFEVVEFLDKCLTHKYLTVNDKKYMLVHSIPEYEGSYKDIEKEDTNLFEYIFGRPDFERPELYNADDLTIVIGHTPTLLIDQENYYGKVFRCGSLIDIDCGCFIGAALCAFRLEDEKEFYVDSTCPPMM